jgi:hypothetical protein
LPWPIRPSKVERHDNGIFSPRQALRASLNNLIMRYHGRMKHILTVSLTSLALLTLAPVAFADVVSPEPASCPEGGNPSTCHGGPHCRPLGCMTDTDCQDGRVCQERSLCVGVVNCAGLLPPDADPSMYDVQTVEGTCSPDVPCDAGATCTTLKVCVPMNSTGSGSSSGGGPDDGAGTASSCDCRFGASTGRLGALALTFGTLVGLGFRRRKRR